MGELPRPTGGHPSVRPKDDILALAVYYQNVARRADAAGMGARFAFFTDIAFALAWAAGMPAEELDEKVRQIKQAAAAASGVN